MANLPTYVLDDSAVTARALEVAGASWDTGMNFGASNAPGIGIATDNPGLDESLFSTGVGSWSLLDQAEAAREPQNSQVIGGFGYINRGTTAWPTSGNEALVTVDVVHTGTNPANVSGKPDNDEPIVESADAHLADLAVGWVEV